MTLEGGCHCGAVRYRISGTFLMAGNCHCTICRRLHGAAYVSWGILADPAQFRWTRGEQHVLAYEASSGRQRCSCARCGSPLASRHGGKVGEVVLASVDGDPGVRPAEHIFVQSRAPWHEITDALPQHATWPPGLQATTTESST